MKKILKIGVICCSIITILIYLYVTNTAFLVIGRDGILTGVTNRTKLTGKLVLPAEVKKIGKEAFEGCTGLTEVDFSACTSLTEIGEWAFDGCTGLTEVHLPVSLSKMNGSIFSGCSNLHRLTVDLSNATYCSKDNLLYTKDMKTLVCAAKSITRISIPDTVTSIGDYAFRGCTDLTSVDLSTCTNLTTIGKEAFYGCKNVTGVHLPASLTQIESKGFENLLPMARFIVTTHTVKRLLQQNGIGEKQIIIEGILGLLMIDKNGRLTGVTDKTKLNGKLILPAEVTKIDERAFTECIGLTKVDFSECTNLTTIGGSAFEGCTGLTEINLSVCSNLTKIDWCAFKRCSSLKEVSLPAGLTYLGDGGFAHCTGLAEVRLPAGLTHIGAGAFADCTNLAEIHLPASLTAIGRQAFWNISPNAQFKRY